MHQLKKLILPLLFVSVFSMSSNGQTKSKQANESVADQLSFTNKNPTLTKTQGSDEYQQVGCSLRDRSGNLWFGTSKEGIYRYDGKEFTQYTERDGLCDNGIFLIFEDKVGNIWFGSKSRISRYDGKKFTTIAIPGDVGRNFLPANSITHPSEKNELWSMMQAKSGTIWLGTTDGIYCYDGKYFTRF